MLLSKEFNITNSTSMMVRSIRAVTNKVIDEAELLENGEFTLNELRDYGLYMRIVLYIGMIINLIVILTLSFQQIRRILIKRRAERSLEYERLARNLLNPNSLNKDVASLRSLQSTNYLSQMKSHLYSPGNIKQKPLSNHSINYSSENNYDNGLSQEFSPQASSASSSSSQHVKSFPVTTAYPQQTSRFTNSKGCKHKLLHFMNRSPLENRNYVTFAFVFHQAIVDLIRITYCFLYLNRLEQERVLGLKPNDMSMNALSGNGYQTGIDSDGDGYYDVEKAANVEPSYNEFSLFYEKYCIQLASFYSILTMVTLINILTMLISETCRFYDLKLNSSDTSNFHCVLFGVLLMWTASLIIISSLMLVGIADTAAPTWKCESGVESTTRSLVINIVWFVLVAFILFIAITYSISMFVELGSLAYDKHRMALYAVNASVMAFSANDHFLKRHIQIVKETTKRLYIIFILLIIFCLTFMPNFVMIILKNTLSYEHLIKLKPFNLIASMINLSNGCFNSFILLFLCWKSKDKFLHENLTINEINNKSNDNISNENEDNTKIKTPLMSTSVSRSSTLTKKNDQNQNETTLKRNVSTDLYNLSSTSRPLSPKVETNMNDSLKINESDSKFCMIKDKAINLGLRLPPMLNLKTNDISSPGEISLHENGAEYRLDNNYSPIVTTNSNFPISNSYSNSGKTKKMTSSQSRSSRLNNKNNFE
jgi:hypothetical protein